MHVAKACRRKFAGAGNDVAIGIARVILYCETVFVITGYPANQPIVKQPESGIGRPAAYQRHCERSEAIHSFFAR